MRWPGFPAGNGEAVALRYLADLTIDDVALTLGVSAGTVKQLRSPLQTLRGQLGTELPPILEEA